MDVTVYHYESFSSEPHKGNPAGVVLDGDQLTVEQMQSVAYQIGFNETAFVCCSSRADYRFRFFTPGHEMALCGHATIATCAVLYQQKLLDNQPNVITITIETQAGILPLTVTKSSQGIQISMRQAAAQFDPFEGLPIAVASALGIKIQDLDNRYPIVYGSTGIWTLLVPIRSLETFSRMNAQNEQFPNCLQQYPHASLHPFCLETVDATAHMHARHFSSPYSGTKEDPVTGTASGVMGAYYIEYIRPMASAQLIVEQGFELQRDGRVFVSVERTASLIEVTITGNAFAVAQYVISASDERIAKDS